MDNVTSSCICDQLLSEAIELYCQSDITEVWRCLGLVTTQKVTYLLQIRDPFDYCTNQSNIYFDVFNFNSQCNYNRMEVAWGQCAGNLSMTFGTFQWKSSVLCLIQLLPSWESLSF